MDTFMLVVLCGCALHVGAETFTDLDNLYKSILKGSNPSIRPRLNQSQTVSVCLMFNLINIVSLDTQQELLTTEYWVSVQWRDELAMWNNSQQSSSSEELYFLSGQIWTPDISIQNSRKQESRSHEVEMIQMNASGWSSWDRLGVSVTQCVLSVVKFPFDKHTCIVKLGSARYHAVKLNISKAELKNESFTSNGEWDVTGLDMEVIDYEYNGKMYQLMTVFITVKRQSLFYVLNLLLPIIIISTINPFVFLVRADSGEKVSISVTLFLSFTVFISLLGGMLPKTSTSTSVISLYVNINLLLSGVCVVCSVFIQRVSQMKDPSWIARICCDSDSDLKEMANKLDRRAFMLFFPLSLLLTIGSFTYVYID